MLIWVNMCLCVCMWAVRDGTGLCGNVDVYVHFDVILESFTLMIIIYDDWTNMADTSEVTTSIQYDKNDKIHDLMCAVAWTAHNKTHKMQIHLKIWAKE